MEKEHLCNPAKKRNLYACPAVWDHPYINQIRQ